MTKTLLALALVVTLPLFAQSQKEPWELTVEERIALRTDPKLAQERVRAAKRDQALSKIHTSSAQSSGSDARPDVDAFDGKTHPELFLPYQVFEQLVLLAFRGDPRSGQVARKGLMPEVVRHGLPPDFWERLRSASTVFIADSLARHDIGQSLHKMSGRPLQRAKETLTLKQLDVCRSRAEALAAVRNEFGRERFDRFLYETIAVHMFSVADRLPDPALLLQAEEGCR